jgi:hypothetical protein
LFGGGVPGAWYDPSDFSTMFQDSAGTTPVTAVDQPVGLILDKSQGLVLGPELVADNNLSTFSVSNVAVTKTNTSFTATVGGTGVTAAVLSVGKWYSVTVQGSSGTIVTLNTADALAPTARTQVRSGFGTVIFFADRPVFYIRNDTAATTTITSVSVKELSGNHAYQIADASRPSLKIDGNGDYYLLFDGSDDSLRTNNINLTSTDKVSVFAGLRKLSDSVRGVIVEFSPTVGTNTGAFLLSSPNSGGASDAAWFSRGTTFSGNPASATGLVAPITFVATGTGDIAGDSAIIRINGVVSGTETGDQGTGNYGNHPLYIGRRNNASVPFNGNLYSLIIVGKTMTAGELSLTESWVNGKTGAYA